MQAYLRSPFVAQIFVYGDSLQSCLVAVVVPDAQYLQDWAPKHGVAGTALEQWVLDPAVKKAILEDMTRTGKAEKVGLRGTTASGSPFKPISLAVEAPLAAINTYPKASLLVVDFQCLSPFLKLPIHGS